MCVACGSVRPGTAGVATEGEVKSTQTGLKLGAHGGLQLGSSGSLLAESGGGLKLSSGVLPGSLFKTIAPSSAPSTSAAAGFKLPGGLQLGGISQAGGLKLGGLNQTSGE